MAVVYPVYSILSVVGVFAFQNALCSEVTLWFCCCLSNVNVMLCCYFLVILINLKYPAWAAQFFIFYYWHRKWVYVLYKDIIINLYIFYKLTSCRTSVTMLGGVKLRLFYTHERTCFAYINSKYSTNKEQVSNDLVFVLY